MIKNLAFLNYLDKEFNGERLLTADFCGILCHAFEMNRITFNHCLINIVYIFQRVIEHGENAQKYLRKFASDRIILNN
jgi:hypothetical protein